MTSLGQRFLGTLLGLAGRHAEHEDLLAYRDRELGRMKRWSVEIHLGLCQTCQRAAARIEEDLQTFQKIAGLFYTCDALNRPKCVGNLRQAIQEWETRDGFDHQAREVGHSHRVTDLRRLAREFDLYFGHRATVAFLLKMESREKKQQNPLVEAESVLRDFLGPAAASAVTQRIVHLQASMERRVQGSLLA